MPSNDNERWAELWLLPFAITFTVAVQLWAPPLRYLLYNPPRLAPKPT